MANPYKQVRVGELPALDASAYGMAYAILALAQALDRKGVLTFAEYRAELARLREHMPDDHASAAPGALFDLLIEQLNRVAKD